MLIVSSLGLVSGLSISTFIRKSIPRTKLEAASVSSLLRFKLAILSRLALPLRMWAEGGAKLLLSIS